AVGGVGVGGLANDEATWGWVTGLVLNADVVDLPPPAERAGEVVPELYRALAARLRDRHGLQDGAAHAVARVLPDVRPGLPAIGAHVHSAGLAGEPVVVVMEAEDRVGHAGQVHHRGDQRRVLAMPGPVEIGVDVGEVARATGEVSAVLGIADLPDSAAVVVVGHRPPG